jgi:hypothetical protein
MKKVFGLLFGIALLSTMQAQTSEKKQTHSKQAVSAYSVNVNFDLVFKDKKGNDLLDSTNEKHFSASDITLFYVEKGEKVKINKPNMDYPNDHFMYKDEATKINHLRVFLEREEVLIKLDDKTTDTIKCVIKKTKGNTHVEKLWYNGILKWEYGKDQSQVITIIK